MTEFTSAIASDRLTLVDFYATWCGPCKQMHPVLEQLQKDLQDDVSILKVDVDQQTSLAETYSVQSIPTLMLFRQGQLLWRQSGVMSLAALRAIIRQYLRVIPR